jgi:hypothetical protein
VRSGQLYEMMMMSLGLAAEARIGPFFPLPFLPYLLFNSL